MSLNSFKYDTSTRFDQSSTRILLSGKSFIADVSGALYWPAEQTLIISDPHIKDDTYVPSPSVSLYTHETRATLIRISDMAQYYDAKRIIILGCGANGIQKDHQLDDENLQRLIDLQKYYNCYWVMTEQAPDFLTEMHAIVADHFILNGITFRQKATRASMSNEIAGGLNPIAKVKTDTKTAGQRCFVSNHTRLIMPTFANCGNGKNILGSDFDPMFSAGSMYVWILGTNDVHPVAPRMLKED